MSTYSAMIRIDGLTLMMGCPVCLATRSAVRCRVPVSVVSIFVQRGYLPDRLGERELVRQADLGRLVRLAADFDDGGRTTRAFVADRLLF